MLSRIALALFAALSLGGPRVSLGEPIFRAVVLLERRPPGAPPRVRFEWTPRDGAVEYVLTGSWTAQESWTVQKQAYRVTRRNATSWSDGTIAFEVSLPPGSHSWKLAPVRLPDGPVQPDVAQISFDLR